MEAIMIQDSNKWNRSILNNICDEDMNIKVPPPSPQDLSMLETVFSKHLSAKMHSVVNTTSHDNFHTQHAQTLEKLLISSTKKPHHQFKRRHYKRPSRIPILSSRIKKKTRTSMQQDALSSAFERIHISSKPASKKSFVSTVRNKAKKNDMSVQETIIQDLKDLNL